MPEASRPVLIGIAGTSDISDSLAEAARQTGCCKLSAVYSRSEARGAAFAQKHGIPLCFSDFASFIGSGALDAVYLASPNFLHYPQTLAALESGRHVLAEKPVAINAAQAGAMFARAKKKGLVLLEAIRPVFDPFLQVVSENLPRIGFIRRATFEFCQHLSRYDRFKAGERIDAFDASLGNASLTDLGVYGLHCCLSLFGRPANIHAGASFLPGGMEAAGTMLLDYETMQATVSYSKVMDSVFPSMIQGEEGTITFEPLNQPAYVSLHHRGRQVEKLPFVPVENNMVHELRAFCRCVRHEESPEAYQAQSMQVMKIMDEARRQTGIDFGGHEAL
jgi:Predicted dehydrogenases and related proteins